MLIIAGIPGGRHLAVKSYSGEPAMRVLRIISHFARYSGLSDGASGALEGDVGDAAVGELHVERELVAAQRVETLGRPGGALELAKVPGPAAVVTPRLPAR